MFLSRLAVELVMTSVDFLMKPNLAQLSRHSVTVLGDLKACLYQVHIQDPCRQNLRIYDILVS